MRIYFSCSLTGGRLDQPAYAALVRGMEAMGHQVLTAHLADLDAMAQDAVLDAASVYARDVAWLEASDAFVAEVTTPSHGVGFEFAHALHLGKRILCLHRQDARVSKMITGCPNPTVQISAYANLEGALAQVRSFLGQ